MVYNYISGSLGILGFESKSLVILYYTIRHLKLHWVVAILQISKQNYNTLCLWQ